jgi:hypothetical protein
VAEASYFLAAAEFPPWPPNQPDKSVNSSSSSSSIYCIKANPVTGQNHWI